MWAKPFFRQPFTRVGGQAQLLNRRARWRLSTVRPPIQTSLRDFSQSHVKSAQYQRFQGRSMFALALLRRWAARRTFYYEVGGLAGCAGIFYVYNLETVPMSGRRRFNVIPPGVLNSTSDKFQDDVLSQYQGKVLPAGDKRTQLVQRVLNRLIPNSGLPNAKWEVHVIDSAEKNAFVVPGGKVFVFTGILPVCAGEDGLAAVLGHEIAHCYANHAAEKMSKTYVFSVPIQLLAAALGLDPQFAGMLVQFGYEMPGSRAQESEADYIGLLIMAQSCYDPSAAIGVWQRMGAAEHGHAPPQFMSTHPSSANREVKIRGWIPDAMTKYQDGGCGGGAIGGLYDGFKEAVGGVGEKSSDEW